MRWLYVHAMVLCVAMMALTVFAAPLPSVPVANDLWDISSGAVVTGYSPMLKGSSSDPRDMLGGNYSAIERSHTLFDDLADGANYTSLVNYVQWRTPSSVTIDSFNLFAAHDGGTRNAYYRGFQYFDLYAYVGGSWQQVYHYNATNPYAPGTSEPNYLWLSASIAPVNAQYFEARFTRYDVVPDPWANGPRIIELDGFRNNAAVPEPASLLLLGMGVLGAAGLRKFKK